MSNKSSYRTVHRDHTFKNVRNTDNLQVPVFSDDPPVSHGGQLYYNSNTKCMNYSTDVNNWSCLNDNVFDNITVNGDTNLKGNVNIGNCQQVTEFGWATKVDGSSLDQGTGIAAVCNSVYATGTYNSLINVYSANGNNQPVYFSNLTVSNFAAYIVKWDTDGQAQWATKVDGPLVEQGLDISAVCDAVYATGYYQNPVNVYSANGNNQPVYFSNLTASSEGSYIVKWDTDGQAQWATKIDGSSFDRGFDISAVSDSIYATGYYENLTNVYNANGNNQPVYFSNLTASNRAAYIVKFDNDGQAQWATKIDGSSIDTGQGISAVCDAVYVTGSYTNSANVYSADGSNQVYFCNLTASGVGSYIVKWDNDGLAQWATKIDGATVNDEGRGISAVCDAVYATGFYNTLANVYSADGSNQPIYFCNLTASADGAYIVKWDTDGQTQWATKIDGATVDEGQGISAVSKTVYATGHYQNSATVYSANGSNQPIYFSNITASAYGSYIVKFNADGQAQWIVTINGAFDDFGFSVEAVSDAVYATGSYTNSANVYFITPNETKLLTSLYGSNRAAYIIKIDDKVITDTHVNICSDVTINGELSLNNATVNNNKLHIYINGIQYKINLEQC
jgi:predicted lipoprotein with Yx(FWY)xxD motif